MRGFFSLNFYNMNTLLICGSVAEKSHTNALLRYIEELLKAENFKTEFWDLKKKPIPIVLPEYHNDPTKHPDGVVRNFVAEVGKAQVIILGSPLHHGSYSGVLKNALDNLHGDAFQGKWVGLVGNAGSLRASHVQFAHLRYVVNALVGYTAQTQVGTCGEDYDELPDKYVLADENIKKRCERLVEELLSLKK